MRPAGTMHATCTAHKAFKQTAPKEQFGTPELKTLGFFAF
jgi:hypothetical protein